MRRKFNARNLRYQEPTEKQQESLERNPIYIILDNVLDTYNIGAIFRLADAIAAEKVIICGRSATPPNIKIHRAAIGTEEWVPWSYEESATQAIKHLRGELPDLTVFAVEEGEESVSYDEADYSFPVAFIVGNETHGVSPEALSLSDQTVEIPMWGYNVSLNVMVSLAIVLWQTMEEEMSRKTPQLT